MENKPQLKKIKISKVIPTAVTLITTNGNRNLNKSVPNVAFSIWQVLNEAVAKNKAVRNVEIDSTTFEIYVAEISKKCNLGQTTFNHGSRIAIQIYNSKFFITMTVQERLIETNNTIKNDKSKETPTSES